MATQYRYPIRTYSNAYLSISGGGDYYEAVDEVTADDDTTLFYGSDATNPGTFLGYFSPFCVSGSITSLVVRLRASSDTDHGDPRIWAQIRVNGTTYVHSSSQSATIWGDKDFTWTTNPDTGSAWTAADINGTGSNPLQYIGCKVQPRYYTKSGDKYIRISQVIGIATADTSEERFPTSDITIDSGITPSSNCYANLNAATGHVSALITSNNTGTVHGFTAFSLPEGASSITLYVRFAGKDYSSGTNYLRAAIKVNGTRYNTTATAEDPPSTTYWTDYVYGFTTNPDTSSAWTRDDINGSGSNPLQGIGVFSNDATPDVYAAYVYAYCTYSVASYEYGAGTMSGAGLLVGAGIRKRLGPGTMAGVGLLSSAGWRRRGFLGTMAGSGVLAGICKRTRLTLGTIAGSGTLVGMCKRIRLALGTMAGTGILAAIGDILGGIYEYGSATMAGVGSLVSTALRYRTNSGILAGSGVISGIVHRIRMATGLIAGTGSLAGLAKRIRLVATTTMTGLGSLISAALRYRTSSGILAGSGIISGIVRRIRVTTGLLVGTGNLTGLSKRIRLAVGAMVGSGLLDAIGSILGSAYKYASATLSGAGGLAVSASRYLITKGTLAGNATMSVFALVARIFGQRTAATGPHEGKRLFKRWSFRTWIYR